MLGRQHNCVASTLRLFGSLVLPNGWQGHTFAGRTLHRGAGTLEQALIEEAARRLGEGAWSGPPIYVVAPPAATLAAERAILQRAGLAGSVRLRVVGAARLSHELLRTLGRPSPDILPDSELRAVVRAVARQEAVRGALGGFPGAEGRLARTMLALWWQAPSLPAASREALGDVLFDALCAATRDLADRLEDLGALPAPLLHWRAAAALDAIGGLPCSVLWAEVPGPPALEALRAGLERAGLLAAAAGKASGAPRPGVSVSAWRCAEARAEWLLCARNCRRILSQGASPSDVAIACTDFGAQRQGIVAALREAGIPVDAGAEPIDGEPLSEILGGLFALADGEPSIGPLLRILGSGLSPASGALRQELLRHLRDGCAPAKEALAWLGGVRERAAGWPKRADFGEHLGYLEDWLALLGIPRLLAAEPVGDRQTAIWNAFWQSAARLRKGLWRDDLPRPVALRMLGDVLGGAVPPAVPQGGAVRVLPLAALAQSTYPHVLLLGLGEGRFPLAAQDAGLVPAGIIARAKEMGAAIAPSPEDRRLRAESFAAQAVHAATRSLDLSFCLRDEQGRPQSPALRMLELAAPQDPPARGLLAGALSREQAGIAIAQAIGMRRDIGAAPKELLGLAAAHLQVAGPGPAFAAFAAKRPEEPVGPLTGEIGVTALERRAACAFQSFAHDVLRLEIPPNRQEIDPRERGSVVHAVLARLPASPEAEERTGLVERLLGEVADELGILPVVDARAAVLRRQLAKALGGTAELFWYEAERAAFQTVGREVAFGAAGTLPPLSVQLPGGGVARLRGRIDRIDRAGRHLRIIDYKARRHQELAFARAYHGLDLQIVVYALAAERSGAYRPAEVSVLAYWPVRMGQRWEEGEPSRAQEDLWRTHRPRGFYLGDPELPGLLDRHSPAASALHPMKLRQDGELAKSPWVLSSTELQGLREHIELRLGELAEEARRGVADPDPYRLGFQDFACQRCGFAALCRHVPQRDGFRRLSRVSKEVLLDGAAPADD